LYEADFDWSGFQWIDFTDTENSVVAFLRKATSSSDAVVCVCNFTPVPRHGYRIGVPTAGWYRELLNTDAFHYGGSNVGNSGGVQSVAGPCHDFPHSLTLTLPPLGMLMLKRDPAPGR
jgi:1,4-alpha-glucan branching enzyme